MFRENTIPTVVVTLLAVSIGLASAVWIGTVRATTMPENPLVEGRDTQDRAVAQVASTDPIWWNEEVSTAPLSITNTVALSDYVLEGFVTKITTATFNTSAGLPPAGVNPILDDPDLDAEWTLHRYAVIEIVTSYVGPITVTHVVVPIRGGSYDSNGDGQPEYIHDVSGIDLTDASVGDNYMIYGVYPWTVPPPQAIGSEWEERGLDLAIFRTASGDPTTFVETYGAYKIVDQMATSDTHGRSYDVTWLRDITANLTN